MSQHTYEELRDVVMDILLRRVSVPLSYEPNEWASLKTGVAEVLASRELNPGQQRPSYPTPSLRGQDAELVRDVFWDLFRQGFITLGMNDDNEQWPWFRLSHFGKKALAAQSPYRFHDANSFLSLVKREVPDISAAGLAYLDEAVAAFYTGCLLASCVMLGVAAEVEFLRLVEVAAANPTHGSRFSALAKQNAIRQKVGKFHECLKPLIPVLPYAATEDLETNLLAIQSVLRIARNDAGHPTGATPQREQVFVYLQLFIPFGRQLMRLRQSLA